MFKNNSMRPAYATAGGDVGNASHFTQNKSDLATFSQSEADDFGSFQSAPRAKRTSKPTGPAKKPANKQPKKKSSFKLPAFNFSPKVAIIIAASVLALLLLIVGVVAIIAIPKNGIAMKDNAYITYIDSKNVARVAVNGKELKHTFKGEVELIPAKDNSFAYVLDKTDGDDNSDGTTTIYILKGSKLEELKVPIDEVVVTAEYKPGIVFKHRNSYYHYSAANGETFISDSGTTPTNFIISGDGSTVLYTKGDDSEGEMETFYYKGGQSYNISTKEIVPSGQIKPKALSNDGNYVYVLATSINSGFDLSTDIGLMYLTVKEKFGDFEFSKAQQIMRTYTFGDVRAMNEKGNEIIIDATKDGETASYFCVAAKTQPNNPKLAVGIFTPIITSDNIVCPETLYNTYFTCKIDATANSDEDEGEDEDEDENGSGDEIPTDSTYVIKKENKAPKAVKLADSLGTFSPDGKLFYYLSADGDLFYIELKSKELKPEKKETGVKAYHIVDNGNMYVFHSDSIFYKDGKRSDRVVTFSETDETPGMVSCNNTIYYMKGEKLFASTNSKAEKEVTKSFNQPLVALPTFIQGAGKKAYIMIEDSNGNSHLYYTSNGKKITPLAAKINGEGGAESAS